MSALSEMIAEAKQARAATAPAKQLVEKIYSGYLDEDDTKFRQKKSFAPSGLFYGSGACAKRWYLSFVGGNFKATSDNPLSIASMRNGIASHERIQNAMKNAGIAKEIERPVRLESPPIFGFADAIIDFEGKEYVGEIKTTTHQNFEYRKKTGKIADYHLGQMLMYMLILGIDFGVVIYESKDTNELYAITIEMTPEYREWAESVLEWCREVWDMYENGIMPKRSFRVNSKVCGTCPLERVCDEADGKVAVRRLPTSP